MKPNTVVSREEWLAARREHLSREKELTQQREALAEARRRLPWVKVEDDYVFEGPDGRESLADLFAGRDQLIVYHFMLGPGWEEGCKHCSFWADNYQGAVVHLAARDVTLLAVSRAPLAEIEAYRKRMGWDFKWVSSQGTSFNFDLAVSFTPEQQASDAANYNFETSHFGGDEAPGLSVFARGDDGAIYHTYSTYARGLDMLNGTYQMLDLVPKGRDEGSLPYPMSWVRHHDRYE
jgi:predicted dithiol-disulfide oxidoreductase (DUF899 family)